MCALTYKPCRHGTILQTGVALGCQALQGQASAPGPSVTPYSQTPASAAAGAQLQTGGVSQDPSASTATSPGAQPAMGGGSHTSADAGQGMASNPDINPTTGAPSWALPLAAAGIGAAGALLAVAAVGCVALAALAAARGLHAPGHRGGHSAPPRGRDDALVAGGSFEAVGPQAGRGCSQPRSLRSLYSCSELDGPCKVLIPEDTAATGNGTPPAGGSKSPPTNSHRRESAPAAESPNEVRTLAANPGAGHPTHASAWPSPGSGSAAGLGLPPAGTLQGQWPYIPARPPPYPAIAGMGVGRHSAPAPEDGSVRALPAMQPAAQQTGAGPEHEKCSYMGGDEQTALQNGGCNGAGAQENSRQQGPRSSAGPRVVGRLQGAALPPSPFTALTMLPFYE